MKDVLSLLSGPWQTLKEKNRKIKLVTFIQDKKEKDPSPSEVMFLDGDMEPVIRALNRLNVTFVAHHENGEVTKS